MGDSTGSENLELCDEGMGLYDIDFTSAVAGEKGRLLRQFGESYNTSNSSEGEPGVFQANYTIELRTTAKQSKALQGEANRAQLERALTTTMVPKLQSNGYLPTPHSRSAGLSFAVGRVSVAQPDFELDYVDDPSTAADVRVSTRDGQDGNGQGWLALTSSRSFLAGCVVGAILLALSLMLVAYRWCRTDSDAWKTEGFHGRDVTDLDYGSAHKSWTFHFSLHVSSSWSWTKPMSGGKLPGGHDLSCEWDADAAQLEELMVLEMAARHANTSSLEEDIGQVTATTWATWIVDSTELQLGRMLAEGSTATVHDAKLVRRGHLCATKRFILSQAMAQDEGNEDVSSKGGFSLDRVRGKNWKEELRAEEETGWWWLAVHTRNDRSGSTKKEKFTRLQESIVDFVFRKTSLPVVDISHAGSSHTGSSHAGSSRVDKRAHSRVGTLLSNGVFGGQAAGVDGGQAAGVEEQLQKVCDEALILSSLRHPNIVTFFGLALVPTQDTAAVHLIMEAGKTTVGKVLQKMSLAVSITVGMQVAEALLFLHRKRLAHRDVKPDNILLCGWRTTTNRDKNLVLAKLCDFGSATIIEKQKSPALTPNGSDSELRRTASGNRLTDWLFSKSSGAKESNVVGLASVELPQNPMHSMGTIRGDSIDSDCTTSSGTRSAATSMMSGASCASELEAGINHATISSTISQRDDRERSTAISASPAPPLVLPASVPVGSVEYMAPEVLAGPTPVFDSLTGTIKTMVEEGDAEAADVYAFGITLWSMCNRRRPYVGITTARLIFGVAQQALRPDYDDQRLMDEHRRRRDQEKANAQGAGGVVTDGENVVTNPMAFKHQVVKTVQEEAPKEFVRPAQLPPALQKLWANAWSPAAKTRPTMDVTSVRLMRYAEQLGLTPTSRKRNTSAIDPVKIHALQKAAMVRFPAAFGAGTGISEDPLLMPDEEDATVDSSLDAWRAKKKDLTSKNSEGDRNAAPVGKKKARTTLRDMLPKSMSMLMMGSIKEDEEAGDEMDESGQLGSERWSTRMMKAMSFANMKARQSNLPAGPDLMQHVAQKTGSPGSKQREMGHVNRHSTAISFRTRTFSSKIGSQREVRGPQRPSARPSARPRLQSQRSTEEAVVISDADLATADFGFSNPMAMHAQAHLVQCHGAIRPSVRTAEA
jgi:serine/threonine protein kinase